MKLLRWAAAGASVYVVYKYSIGKKAKGEDVFKSPERELDNGGDAVGGNEAPAAAKTKKPAASRKTKQES